MQSGEWPTVFRSVKSARPRSFGAGQGDFMARITEMPPGTRPMWIHDVTHPVSWKWFCYRDDGLLLQYALNKFMAREELSDLKGKPTIGPMGREWPPLAPLKVDGIFGNKTQGALTAFQRNRCVAVDGDVDPVYKYIAGLGGASRFAAKPADHDRRLRLHHVQAEL